MNKSYDKPKYSNINERMNEIQRTTGIRSMRDLPRKSSSIFNHSWGRYPRVIEDTVVRSPMSAQPTEYPQISSFTPPTPAEDPQIEYVREFDDDNDSDEDIQEDEVALDLRNALANRPNYL